MRYDDPSATWEDQAVAVVRGLAMDAPFTAKNGHSGTAMALAPLGVALFSRVLRHDPADPKWPDRDRFILSCGHASILLYSLLHLSGYDLSVDELRRFRQLGSITPGHPENRLTEGVEVTTGPLGQGFGNAVGMAIAERFLRDRIGEELVDHRTWVFASDGDLMEGVSHEAASLAGHLGLERLCVVYDDNHITIDGATELALNDDPAARFRAYGWDVRELGEVADELDTLTDALRAARTDTGRPTLLILRSHIGYPAPTMTDNKEAHGTPFSAEEIAATKALLGLPDEPFFVPDHVRDAFTASLEPMRDARMQWCRATRRRPGARDPPRAAARRCPRCAGAHRDRLVLPRQAASDEEVRERPARRGLEAPRGDDRGCRGPDREHRRVADRRGARSQRRPPVAASCTTASASSRWPPR